MAPTRQKTRQKTRKDERKSVKQQHAQDKADKAAKNEADKAAKNEADTAHVFANDEVERADDQSFTDSWYSKQSDETTKRDLPTLIERKAIIENMFKTCAWTEQLEDPYILIHVLGPMHTSKMAKYGFMEAQWSKGCFLLDQASKDPDSAGMQKKIETGLNLIKSAAGQDHVHALQLMGERYYRFGDNESIEAAMTFFRKAGDFGSSKSMYSMAESLWENEEEFDPFHKGAINWFRKAANAGHRVAALRLCYMYEAGWSLGAVYRSKELSMAWRRCAAESAHPAACLQLAARMYTDTPYARIVGFVEDTTEVPLPHGFDIFHIVPPDFDLPPAVLIDVVYWLQKGHCYHNDSELFHLLFEFRRAIEEGMPYCDNEGCKVVGNLKEFKVCPQCKTVRFCSKKCFEEHWTKGDHKTSCGKQIQQLKSAWQYVEVRFGCEKKADGIGWDLKPERG